MITFFIFLGLIFWAVLGYFVVDNTDIDPDNVPNPIKKRVVILVLGPAAWVIWGVRAFIEWAEKE